MLVQMKLTVLLRLLVLQTVLQICLEVKLDLLMAGLRLMVQHLAQMTGKGHW